MSDIDARMDDRPDGEGGVSPGCSLLSEHRPTNDPLANVAFVSMDKGFGASLVTSGCELSRHAPLPKDGTDANMLSHEQEDHACNGNMTKVQHPDFGRTSQPTTVPVETNTFCIDVQMDDCADST